MRGAIGEKILQGLLRDFLAHHSDTSANASLMKENALRIFSNGDFFEADGGYNVHVRGRTEHDMEFDAVVAIESSPPCFYCFDGTMCKGGKRRSDKKFLHFIHELSAADHHPTFHKIHVRYSNSSSISRAADGLLWNMKIAMRKYIEEIVESIVG